MASWPPQPWTWTSTNPGATYGRVGDRLVAQVDPDDPPVGDRDPAVRDPIVEDEPTVDRGRRRAGYRSPPPVVGSSAGPAPDPSTSNWTSSP